MKKKFIITLLVTTVLNIHNSLGCTCIQERIEGKDFIEVEIENNSWIGIGKIVEVNDNVFPREYRIEVKETFKGDPNKVQKIVSGLGRGDCGYLFELNESYLIYGNRFLDRGMYKKEYFDGEIEVNNCSRTSKLKNTADVSLLNHYINKEEYPAYLTSIENQFVLNKIEGTEKIPLDIQLFYFENRLISKTEFFNLDSGIFEYEYRRFSEREIAKVSSERVKENMKNGILIAYRFRKVKAGKVIRRLRKGRIIFKIDNL